MAKLATGGAYESRVLGPVVRWELLENDRARWDHPAGTHHIAIVCTVECTECSGTGCGECQRGTGSKSLDGTVDLDLSSGFDANTVSVDLCYELFDAGASSKLLPYGPELRAEILSQTEDDPEFAAWLLRDERGVRGAA